jgi:uncharacterized membrane protein YcfT
MQASFFFEKQLCKHLGSILLTLGCQTVRIYIYHSVCTIISYIALHSDPKLATRNVNTLQIKLGLSILSVHMFVVHISKIFIHYTLLGVKTVFRSLSS